MEARPRKVTEATPSAHQAERKVLLLKKVLPSREKSIIVKKKYYQAARKVLVLKKVLPSREKSIIVKNIIKQRKKYYC